MESLKKLANKVKPFGWHMEFLAHVDEFPELDNMLDGFPVDTVYGHLGMSGQLLLQPADAPDEKHLRVRVRFADDGRELRFVDQRMFGGLALEPTDAAGVPEPVAHIARDPLDPAADDHLALLHHEGRVFRGVDIFDHVARNRNDVGQLEPRRRVQILGVLHADFYSHAIYLFRDVKNIFVLWFFGVVQVTHVGRNPSFKIKSVRRRGCFRVTLVAGTIRLNASVRPARRVNETPSTALT